MIEEINLNSCILKYCVDSNTTLKELKDIVQKFCEERTWDQFHSPKDLAIGISTEASELLEIFRFKSEKEVNELFNNFDKKEKIRDELADILYFLLRFAQMNNIDISEAFKNKIKKSEKKYPIEKSKGSNKKYDEL